MTQQNTTSETENQSLFSNLFYTFLKNITEFCNERSMQLTLNLSTFIPRILPCNEHIVAKQLLDFQNSFFSYFENHQNEVLLFSSIWIPKTELTGKISMSIEYNKEKVIQKQIYFETGNSHLYFADFLDANGINLEAGLRFTNNDFGEYMDTLKTILSDYENMHAETFSLAGTRNFRQIALHMHSVKNRAGLAGADFFTSLATRLELAANKEDYAYLSAAFPLYIIEAEKFAATLLDVTTQYDAQTSAKETESYPEYFYSNTLTDNYELLEEYLDNYEAKPATMLLKYLLTTSNSEPTKQLLQEVFDCVNNLEYEDAITILQGAKINGTDIGESDR